MDPLPVIDGVFAVGMKLIERFFPDPATADAAKLKLLEMQQAGELAQLAADTDLAKGQLRVNEVEAANGSVFTSGWRPFVGWTCGAAFAYKFVLAPFIVLALTAAGNPINLPVLDFTEMSTILLGMLGLGGMRTVEKLKGVA
ncbi:MAG TPA: holin family protein [Devosia sp.]|jgi:hypothetical protein